MNEICPICQDTISLDWYSRIFSYIRHEATTPDNQGGIHPVHWSCQKQWGNSSCTLNCGRHLNLFSITHWLADKWQNPPDLATIKERVSYAAPRALRLTLGTASIALLSGLGAIALTPDLTPPFRNVMTTGVIMTSAAGVLLDSLANQPYILATCAVATATLSLPVMEGTTFLGLGLSSGILLHRLFQITDATKSFETYFGLMLGSILSRLSDSLYGSETESLIWTTFAAGAISGALSFLKNISFGNPAPAAER